MKAKGKIMTDKKVYRQRKRYKERKAQGLCVQCGNPVEDRQHVKCDRCLTKQREAEKRYYLKKIWG
jgi:uncharacterized paraquat-inducible protein A